MSRSIKTVLAVRPWLVALLASSAWLVAACNDEDKADVAQTPSAGEPSSTDKPSADAAKSSTDIKASTRNLVQWKRAAAVEADLMRALDLKSDELCKELGSKDCIRDVHLVPMGGNEPYVSGLMKPSVEPLATSPAVVDRVLLSACSKRADLDAEAKGNAKVFTKLKFDKPLPAADDPAVRDTVVELYHRLLSREPAAKEVSLVAALADKPSDADALSPHDFAALACFSIGSTTEFLFY
jgi:hypothetical protein